MKIPNDEEDQWNSHTLLVEMQSATAILEQI